MKSHWNPEYPAALDMNVILNDGYTGDWRAALDHAKRIATQLDIYVSVSYAGQKRWLISKNTDIETLKNERVVVAV